MTASSDGAASAFEAAPAVSHRTIDLWTWVLVVALAAGAALRLWGLTAWGYTHPEMYVPGLELVPGLSEPPPRMHFVETLIWHFHSEAHPVGYYMAMWAWVKLVGTGELMVRLASVLVGLGSVWLTWKLGRAVFGRAVGALGALLVALNGFQIYWSQLARAYVAGEFCALLATWLLVEWTRSGTRRPWLEAGYVAAVIAGTQMLEQFWAVAFLHVVWAALVLPAGERPSIRGVLLAWATRTARIVQVQAIALALALPEFVHLAMLGRHRSEHEAAPRFLSDYLDFGFLFELKEVPSIYPEVPGIVVGLLAIVALALMVVGMRAPSSVPAQDRAPPVRFAVCAAAAIVGAVLSLALAMFAPKHRVILALVALLPLMTLWLPGICAVVRSAFARLLPAVERGLSRVGSFPLLMALLALVTPLLVYAVSSKVSALVPRGFLPFTPFYLLLIAAGLIALARGPVGRSLALGGASALFLASAVFFHGHAAGPIDYRGAAAAIAREEHSGDVVMVRARSWADTPLLHYLPRARYLAADPDGELAAQRPERVWLPQWLDDGAVQRDARQAALDRAGYAEVHSVPVTGAAVALYVRREGLPGRAP